MCSSIICSIWTRVLLNFYNYLLIILTEIPFLSFLFLINNYSSISWFFFFIERFKNFSRGKVCCERNLNPFRPTSKRFFLRAVSPYRMFNAVRSKYSNCLSAFYSSLQFFQYRKRKKDIMSRLTDENDEIVVPEIHIIALCLIANLSSFCFLLLFSPNVEIHISKVETIWTFTFIWLQIIILSLR